MSFFIPNAEAQTGGGIAGDGFTSILLIGGMFVLMYFMIIRPQRKRQKNHLSLVDNLGKGDEAITNGGILGKVVKVDENYMVLEVSPNVELKFQKASLHAVLPKGTIKAI
ncbi:MAG: preprotein translocase subunit YajC [Cellvibrionaceae bacterium]|jgi:preprotein translocase subunit YajC